MRATLYAFAVTSLTCLSLSPAVAQAPAGGPTSADSSLPGVTVMRPGASTTDTLPPGVADPMKTNSTTGTVDQEDHCQAPGRSANSNPSAEATTLPRPEPVCR